jgi:hypothetical protein
LAACICEFRTGSNLPAWGFRLKEKHHGSITTTAATEKSRGRERDGTPSGKGRESAATGHRAGQRFTIGGPVVPARHRQAIALDSGTIPPFARCRIDAVIGKRGQPTMSSSYHSSRADTWSMPRPHTDASLRYQKYGPIRPMEEDRGFLRRLFARR